MIAIVIGGRFELGVLGRTGQRERHSLQRLSWLAGSEDKGEGCLASHGLSIQKIRLAKATLMKLRDQNLRNTL